MSQVLPFIYTHSGTSGLTSITVRVTGPQPSPKWRSTPDVST